MYSAKNHPFQDSPSVNPRNLVSLPLVSLYGFVLVKGQLLIISLDFRGWNLTVYNNHNSINLPSVL